VHATRFRVPTQLVAGLNCRVITAIVSSWLARPSCNRAPVRVGRTQRSQRACRATALMCVALAAPIRVVGAQETRSARNSALPPPAPGIWLSAGLGLSTGGGPSWLAGINYSPGIALISIDAAGSDLLSNSDVQVRAVMLGLRSHESGGMASASLGLARAHRAGGCDDCGTTTPGPTASALAFSAAAHANRFGIGFALGTFGVAGPPGVRYVSFLLSLEAGCFGEPR
jgi:hypothetical protein